MTRSYRHDAVTGQDFSQLPQRTQHCCWNAFVRSAALKLFLPLLLQCFDMAQIGSPGLPCLMGLIIRDSGEDVGEHKLAIGRDANLRGIIFADLARIDVDLDELSVGDRERHTFAVGRCRPVCEAATEGHDHISIGGRVVAGQRSRPAGCAGATMCGKSGDAKRSSSCITPWPRIWVAALPVIRSSAVESQCAVASPIIVFVAPGPIEVQATIGWPVTR